MSEKAMKLEEIKMYEFTCTPVKSVKDGIRSVVVNLVATDDNDARNKMFKVHEFFNQDINRSQKILYKGFRQVEK